MLIIVKIPFLFSLGVYEISLTPSVIKVPPANKSSLTSIVSAKGLNSEVFVLKKGGDCLEFSSKF